MGRHTVCRLYDRVLPDEICDCIVKLGDELELVQAYVVSKGDKGVRTNKVDRSIRETQTAFWDSGHWISGLLTHYVDLANRELWGYSLSISQGVQFGVYGLGGMYDWHQDESDLPYGEESRVAWRGLSRKVSVVANLSDPKDYEGGQLRFKDTYGRIWEDPELDERLRQRGTVVVFPSYIVHTVMPVTRGVRRSIVSWILGPPFR